MRRLAFLIAPLVMMAVGCSTTPGDAAYRAGHAQQAAELYRAEANQGDAEAALKLGLLLDEGKVSPAIFGTAGQAFTKGCKLGSLASCHNVGVAYEYGKNGLAQDRSEARTYYEKAAKLGYMQSQYNLASLYANRYFSNDIEGYKWLLVSQMQAEKCASQPLCEWVLRDPPGHKQKLHDRMSEQDLRTAKQQASAWR